MNTEDTYCAQIFLGVAVFFYQGTEHMSALSTSLKSLFGNARILKALATARPLSLRVSVCFLFRTSGKTQYDILDVLERFRSLFNGFEHSKLYVGWVGLGRISARAYFESTLRC